MISADVAARALTGDAALAGAARALDAGAIEPALARALTRAFGQSTRVRVRDIRVLRHKPARRCLLEFSLDIERGEDGPVSMVLLGKARARGAPVTTDRVLRALRRVGFHDDSPDGLSVPEPFGVLAEFGMGLQQKVPGRIATELLPGERGTALAARVAALLHKLHRTAPVVTREHTIDDELRVLHERLGALSLDIPRWISRRTRLLKNCVRVARKLEPAATGMIHRDFYPDQVIVGMEGLYLIDLDLLSVGDPALDAGNFVAHLIEQGLREQGDPDALAEPAAAFVEGYTRLAGRDVDDTVRTYATLTLARHIQLSTSIEGRRHTTARLVELCEERVGVHPRHLPASAPAASPSSTAVALASTRRASCTAIS